MKIKPHYLTLFLKPFFKHCKKSQYEDNFRKLKILYCYLYLNNDWSKYNEELEMLLHAKLLLICYSTLVSQISFDDSRSDALRNLTSSGQCTNWCYYDHNTVRHIEDWYSISLIKFDLEDRYVNHYLSRPSTIPLVTRSTQTPSVTLNWLTIYFPCSLIYRTKKNSIITFISI